MRFAPIKRLRGSIFLRIAVLFSATFSLGLSSAFVITYFQIRHSLEKSSREILSSKLEETAAVLQTDGVQGLSRFLSVEKNRTANAPYLIRLLTATGDLAYIKASVQTKNFNFDKAFGKVDPERLLGWQSIPAFDDEDRFIVLTERVSDNFYLQVGKSNEDHEDILENILDVFVITGISLILLSACVGAWYARKALNPLRGLLSTIGEIEKGDLSRRVNLSETDDELRHLGQTFNRMVSRIEKLVLVMGESLDNVAHDIRTPLTRIRVVAEDAIMTHDPAVLQHALEDCAECATDISSLVDQLMNISEAEAGTLALRYERCDVKTLLENVAEIYEFVAQEKGVQLSVAPIEESLFWDLDPRRIRQAIANLTDNAIKFSPTSTEVLLSACVKEGQLHISVRDEGPGIPDSDLPRIWERLFRGDRSRSTAGLGLGLSIVRSVAIAHGGHVDAHANLGRGMLLTLVVPPKITNL